MNFISYDKQIKLNNQPTNNDVKQKIKTLCINRLSDHRDFVVFWSKIKTF